MGQIIYSPSMGGGAVDLSFITATSDKILEGYIGSDTEGNQVEGSIKTQFLDNYNQIMNCGENVFLKKGYYENDISISTNSLSSQTTATALASDITAGKTAWVNGEMITGNVTNQGAKTATLNAGQSYTIPLGFHNGSGKVTANELASQTSATAAANHILSGKTAYVNGVKVTGNMTVQSVQSFSVAAYSTTQFLITWKNPNQASGKPFSGVVIRWKTGGYPLNPADGSVWMGAGNNTAPGGTSSVTLGGFTAGTTYYFRVWGYCVCSSGNYTINNVKVLLQDTLYKQSTGKTTAHGRKAFTTSGTWTIPAGVRTINVHLVGGGGAGKVGGTEGSYYKAAGSGGSGGESKYKNGIAVAPGNIVTVIVGAGGTNKNPSSVNTEKTGGDTTITINNSAKTSLIATGGLTEYSDNGYPPSPVPAGSGVVGRGADLEFKSINPPTAGGNGTRDFGDPKATVRSSGGGGGGGYRYNSGSETEYHYEGMAGGVGAGKGGSYNYNGTDGVAGTGSGGGGGGFGTSYYTAGNGSIGCVIITW